MKKIYAVTVTRQFSAKHYRMFKKKAHLTNEPCEENFYFKN